MSILTDIADDIVTAINAGTYAITDIESLRAERVEFIQVDLEKLNRLHVEVMPKLIETADLNRNATVNVYPIAVVVQKLINTADNTDFDRYSTFIDQIENTLTNLASTTQPTSCWNGLEFPVAYSPASLRTNSLFQSVIETRYRMGR